MKILTNQNQNSNESAKYDQVHFKIPKIKI